MSAALTPLEVQQLFAIRLNLDSALRGAERAGVYRRGAAIVALDAMVERSASLVAVTRGLHVTDNTKLADLISRVKQSLGGLWNPTVLADVRLLREARNSAQHAGLEPDPAAVPVWSRAVELFVVTIIEAQFGVDVRRVVLSDAIEDGDLRSKLDDAERAFDRDEWMTSVRASIDAYDWAVGVWRRMRRTHEPLFRADPLDSSAHDAIASMRAVRDAATFASDGAEAEWFTDLRAERGDVFDRDDASRALTFAFTWIASFENAASTWVTDRRRRAAIAARAVRRGAETPRIADATLLPDRIGHAYVSFTLADLPHEDDFPAWADALRRLLPSATREQRWHVHDDGTVMVERPADDIDAFADDVATLRDALKHAEQSVADTRAAARADRERRDAEDAERTTAIHARRTSWPSWVRDITASRANFRGDAWLVDVVDDVMRLEFGPTPEGFAQSAPDIADLIRAHERVEQCWGSGPRTRIAIEPLLEPDVLVEVLHSFDEVVSTTCAAAESASRDREARRDDARAALAAALAPGR